MERDYTAAVEAHLRERRTAEADKRTAADAWRSETDALDRAVATAAGERDRAVAAEADARALADRTESTADALWRALGGFVGHRRTGPTPYSSSLESEPDADRVRARLSRADRLLTLARGGELPIEAPRHTEITAAVIGAALGALGVAAAVLLLGYGPDAVPEAARQALAAAALFAGAGAGPVVLGAWLAWQYRVRPRPGQIIACVTCAVVATCGLAGLLLRGM